MTGDGNTTVSQVRCEVCGRLRRSGMEIRDGVTRCQDRYTCGEVERARTETRPTYDDLIEAGWRPVHAADPASASTGGLRAAVEALANAWDMIASRRRWEDRPNGARQWQDRADDLRRILAAHAEDACGAWGGCPLPSGHNRGQADVPESHGRAALAAHAEDAAPDHRLALLRAVVAYDDANQSDLPLTLLDAIRAEVGGPR